jgi:two-component system, NtrC family, sensor histidine kinase HydH
MRTRTNTAGGWTSEALESNSGLETMGMKVAHELKNPLSAVKALVQLGLNNPAESASHERLAVLKVEVARMQEILMRYLSSAQRIREVVTERVHLGPLVSDTLRVLSARADAARVRLSSRGDACVEGDPRRLKEALLDLIANGIEATPAGGEVVVEVRADAHQIEIVVRDTGRGMTPETLRQVGIPFFTTREEGTGLGVAFARSIFAQHGGFLGFESEPGKGTTVRATLPSRPRSA